MLTWHSLEELLKSICIFVKSDLINIFCIYIVLLLLILACVSYIIFIWDRLTAMDRIDRDNMSAILWDIYDELNPNTIDRIMAYLITVYKLA